MQSNTPTTASKDVFVHLLILIALYASAISVLVLVFQLVNISIPDSLSSSSYSPYYSVTRYYKPIRFAMATLLVFYPLFLALSWYMQREYRGNPERRQGRVRRWLQHFTLFATALIMGGDLVSVVYNYLNGEASTRFFLKALAVLIVAAVIFGYYLWDIKQPHLSRGARWFAIPVSVAVVGLIVWMFVVVGTPQKQRAYRMDEERVKELQTIASGIRSYVTNTRSLPDTLSAIVPKYVIEEGIRDPKTDAVYEFYQVKEQTYTLCADFALASISKQAYPKTVSQLTSSQKAWEHDAGRYCFELNGQQTSPPVFE